MRLSVRAALVGAATTIALFATAVPATAEHYDVADGSGDVWSPDGPGWSKEGSVTNTDLVRTVVRHRARTVLFLDDYAALRKHGAEETAFEATIRIGKVRAFHLFYDEVGDSVPWIVISRGDAHHRVDCDGLAGRTDYRADRVRIVVPRSCLDDPRWIRCRTWAWSYTETEGLFVDDARSAGHTPKGWSPRITRS